MNWKTETCKRRDAVKKIDKEISLLEKQKKKLGSVRALEIIRVSIEKELGLPTKIVSYGNAGNHYLVVFAEDTTKKQVHYRRREKMNFILEVCDDIDGYFIQYRNLNGVFTDMPENTDEIIKIMEEMQ